MRFRSLVLAGTIAGLLVVSTPVSAHSDLRTSKPVDGQTIRRATSLVVLVFWSPVSKPKIEMTGPDGDRVEGEVRQIDDVTINFETDTVTDAGGYRLTYEVLGSDGDTTEGEIGFLYTPRPSSGSTGRTIAIGAVVLAVAYWAVARIKRKRPRNGSAAGPLRPDV